jgi:hypothetical protein
MHLIENAVDAHVHSSPDVVDRLQTDLELASSAAAANMAGIVIKNHVFPTVGRVNQVNEAVGEQILYGSITLNGSVGGLNPDAVEATLNMDGRVVWLPTLWSRQNAEKAWESGNTYTRGQRAPTRGEELTVTEDGELLPEVRTIIDLVSEHDAVLATGHISYDETVAVAKACQETGATCLVTHAFSDYIDATIREQQHLVELGAYLEYCALTLQNTDLDHSTVAEALDRFGADRCILTSDFGQVRNPSPVEGLEEFGERIIDAGASMGDVRKSVTQTPKNVLGIS